MIGMHDHSHHPTTENIKLAFALNLGFTLFEIAGGLWTNSLAILSDAVHDLGDSIALGSAWYLENLSHKKSDEKYSYGYRRFSLLGAVITTLVLVTGSLFILSEAIPRLLSPESVHEEGMLVFALIGIVVNGIAALRLRKDSSINSQTVAWHLIEDILGWVAVLIVSIVLMFQDLPILDPILSILITLYILFNVLKNLKKTIVIFLQAVPEEGSIESFNQQVLQIEGVTGVHHTHIWSLDGEHNVISTHIVVRSDSSREDILAIKNAIKQLIDKQNYYHSTVEIEYAGETCRMDEKPV